jgi:hypothetical protein
MTQRVAKRESVLRDFFDRESRDRQSRAMEELAKEMKRGRRGRRFQSVQLADLPTELADRIPPKLKGRVDPAKVKAAREALESVRRSGRTPNPHVIETESDRLGAKVSRESVEKYRDLGLIDF